MKLKALAVLGLSSLLIFFTAIADADAKKRDYSERLALVTEFAGEEVPYVRFGLPRTSHNWEYLNDETILVWHTRQKAYLVGLEKSAGCRHLDREYSIELENSVNDLDTRNGYIDLRYGGWCKINKIRPIDVAAFKKAEKLKRESKS